VVVAMHGVELDPPQNALVDEVGENHLQSLTLPAKHFIESVKPRRRGALGE
jgi:hypothetical protein